MDLTIMHIIYEPKLLQLYSENKIMQSYTVASYCNRTVYHKSYSSLCLRNDFT